MPCGQANAFAMGCPEGSGASLSRVARRVCGTAMVDFATDTVEALIRLYTVDVDGAVVALKPVYDQLPAP